ncbi:MULTISPECIES: SRPBCC family protein [unclassified Mycobacterium]|uniref:SRPBCC family protein n=1 Tax=unclassified Mycobacterium TaxID=2642494 RepID=UPI0029C8009E|nr:MULTISPECIES: SRPBCC family protein [unclassified Mycobacterium]
MANPLTSSISIAKPPGILWNLLTAAEGLTDWYDNWDAVDYTGDRGFLRVGSTFRLLRQGNSAWCRVTLADPPHLLRWLEVADGGVTVAVEFRLKSDETGGTVLIHTKTAIEPDAAT